MKTLSAPTLAHLGADTTTFQSFWKIERRDGMVQGFTGHVRDVVYDGVTYKAASGVMASNVVSGLGRGVDNLSILGTVNSPDIEEADLLNGFYDDSYVEVFLLNYLDLTQDPLILVAGYIGEVKVGRKSFEAEIRSLMQRCQQMIGKACSPLCRVRQLGDADCTLNLVPYTFAGTVSTPLSLYEFRTTTAAVSGKPFAYFAYGALEWTSGANVGKPYEIRTHNIGSPMTIRLDERVPFPIQAGDAFTIVAGCDRTFNSCKNKFGNVLNFQGEPYVPGTDFVLRVVKT